MSEKKQILFYRTGDAYGAFSNFSSHPITLDDAVWPTSEHYFQARKFTDPKRIEAIRTAPDPMTAARMGRDRSFPIRPHWDLVKDDIMRQAVLAKFTQHADLTKLLLETGDAEIVEHTINDDYWADGGDGRGKNMLGQILMEVRDILRKGGA